MIIEIIGILADKCANVTVNILNLADKIYDS